MHTCSERRTTLSMHMRVCTIIIKNLTHAHAHTYSCMHRSKDVESRRSTIMHKHTSTCTHISDLPSTIVYDFVHMYVHLCVNLSTCVHMTGHVHVLSPEASSHHKYRGVGCVASWLEVTACLLCVKHVSVPLSNQGNK